MEVVQRMKCALYVFQKLDKTVNRLYFLVSNDSDGHNKQVVDYRRSATYSIAT